LGDTFKYKNITSPAEARVKVYVLASEGG